MATREERQAVIAQAAKMCDPKTCSVWLLRAVEAEKSDRLIKAAPDAR